MENTKPTVATEWNFADKRKDAWGLRVGLDEYIQNLDLSPSDKEQTRKAILDALGIVREMIERNGGIIPESLVTDVHNHPEISRLNESWPVWCAVMRAVMHAYREHFGINRWHDDGPVWTIKVNILRRRDEEAPVVGVSREGQDNA